MGRNNSNNPMNRARDELFSHVIRCDVLDATLSDRHDWLDETMDYMAHRHPHLSDLQLAQLELIGRRFIAPAIPHGAHATELNRDEWQSPDTDTATAERESTEMRRTA